jgi:hypothetical protein
MKFNKTNDGKNQQNDTQVVDAVDPDLAYAEPDRLPTPTPTGATDDPTPAQPASPSEQLSRAPSVSATAPLTAEDKAQGAGASHIRNGFDGLSGAGYFNPSNWSLSPIDDERIEFIHVNGTIVRSNIAEFNLFLTTGGR